jgi:hypothetical protein
MLPYLLLNYRDIRIAPLSSPTNVMRATGERMEMNFDKVLLRWILSVLRVVKQRKPIAEIQFF